MNLEFANKVVQYAEKKKKKTNNKQKYDTSCEADD